MARNFNGSSDYAAPASLTVSSLPFSVGCWFRASAGGWLWGANTIAVNNGWYLRLFGGSLEVVMGAVAGVGSNAFSTAGATGGVWGHALGVVTASNIYAYLNGGNKGSTSNGVGTPTPLYEAVGCRGQNASNRDQYFAGDIAELTIWNAALSDDDARQLATGVSPWKIRPELIASYWPMVGRLPPEPDIVNQNSLTVTGAVSADHPRIRKSRSRRSVHLGSNSGGSGGGSNSNCFGHGFLPPLLRAAISN